MSQIADHPQRYQLANELHARPFPNLKAPCHAVYLALKPSSNAARRDREADRAHLIALLDRHGAPHPQPGATHYSGKLGKHKLKWESHTEFVTFTLFVDGVEDRAFDPQAFHVFPEDWLAEAPGTRITSALIRVEILEVEPAQIREHVRRWFVPESVAVAHVLDDSAVIAGDFRIDDGGHVRFAVFARPNTGSRRVGRIVQRLTEIETYKTMAMLGLTRARDLGGKMTDLDTRLTELMAHMSGNGRAPEEVLTELLEVATELENLLAQTTFRFGATGAYEAIVTDRIEVLREERFEGRQSFTEFMTRRFDPAMRTVASTEARLKAMAERSRRAGELLRTRVDVERQAQNQTLLESMDRRADLQLRLQQTVEGLSVVAISYYAVNLATYMLAPAAKGLDVEKPYLTAGLTPIVLFLVWRMVRAIRNRMH